MDSEIIYKEIGKLVKKERRKKGITQEKLAELTSYSLSFIANIESNTHQSFSIHTLYNIANALNISIHNLIPDKPIDKKEYQLSCSNCKYIVNIPKELGKLTEDITLIAKDITFTCPNCEKKILKIKQ
ncbi:MAG TPA: helix-turn-helix transcriptional regulator [Candidatus Caccenecus avistercoris]|nr:helix-turn-helix transcriptional regulator [Candidatus Caccenecus avistercoris]